MLLTKTVEELDYKLIENEVVELRETQQRLKDNNFTAIDIGHEHRFWEYGMALKAFHTWWNGDRNNLSLVDVGAGDSLLGPTFSVMEEIEILEIEPRTSCYRNRIDCNIALRSLGAKEISFFQGTTYNTELKGQKFNAVFCISVIEHV